jgi:hypothetical protein
MANGYTVTNQRQTTRLVGGQFQDIMEVSFQTDRGESGSVTIPLSQYSADAVKAAVQPRVDAMDDVAGI